MAWAWAGNWRAGRKAEQPVGLDGERVGSFGGPPLIRADNTLAARSSCCIKAAVVVSLRPATGLEKLNRRAHHGVQQQLAGDQVACCQPLEKVHLQ